MKFEISNLNIISSELGNSNDDFWINMQVDISAINDYGSEVFNINVVGIKRLKNIVESEDLYGRGIIICRNFSELRLRKMLENLLKKVNADSFDQLCAELEKYFDRL